MLLFYSFVSRTKVKRFHVINQIKSRVHLLNFVLFLSKKPTEDVSIEND